MSVLPKSKKATVGIGVAAAAAAAIALGGGTYAAFSDSETGPGGTLAAGTLDLVVGGTPGQAKLLDVKDLVPGTTVPEKTLTITNAGSVPGVLTGTLNVSGTDGGKCTEPEAAAEGVGVNGCAAGGNLAEQLTITVKELGTNAPVSQVQSGAFPLSGTELAPGQVITFTVGFALPNLPGTENNKVQGDTVTIASTLDLTQKTS